MERDPRRRSASSSQPKLSGRTSAGPMNHDRARQMEREIVAINASLEEIRNLWATAVGVSGPQWTILMALHELDQGNGVPVKVVSKMLCVESSFVSTQSKILEKKGLMRRKQSGDDGRVVQMSLTDKSYKQIASLLPRQEALNNFIFSDFSELELSEFVRKLSILNARLEKAFLKVSMGI